MRIALHRQYSIKIRQDAALRAIDFAENSKDINAVTQFLLKQDGFRWPWYVVSEKLFENLANWKAYKQAAKLSDKIQRWVPSEKNQRRRVYAHYRAGNSSHALQILKKSKRVQLRAPASILDQEVVLRRLENLSALPAKVEK